MYLFKLFAQLAEHGFDYESIDTIENESELVSIY